MASDYFLSRWSFYVRARDGFQCQLCHRKIGDYCPRLKRKLKRSDFDAHHTKPKSLFPKLALSLKNGVCVCSEDHQPLIHSEEHNWREFNHNFTRHNKRVAVKSFNEKYQGRLT